MRFLRVLYTNYEDTEECYAAFPRAVRLMNEAEQLRGCER